MNPMRRKRRGPGALLHGIWPSVLGAAALLGAVPGVAASDLLGCMPHLWAPAAALSLTLLTAAWAK